MFWQKRKGITEETEECGEEGEEVREEKKNYEQELETEEAI